MALKPPSPNIELLSKGEITPEELREFSRKVQRLQDFICKQFPLRAQNFALGENSVTAAHIKAEAVGLSELSTAAEQNFLQLAVAAGRKVNFGETKIKINSGAETSETKSITHSLGAKPIAVILQVEKASGATTITTRITERTETVFKAMFNYGGAKAAGNEELTFMWTAIG